MTEYSNQAVMMPYPGRRAKKVATWTLAMTLIFLTFIGGILPVLPGIVDSLVPASQSSQTLNSGSKSTAPANLGPGVPLPPGTIESGSHATPTVSRVADATVSPQLTTTVDFYIYQTSFGTYYFNRTAPYIFKLSSLSGTFLTKASFFFISGPATLSPGNSNVLVALDNQFKVSYDVLFNGVVIGHLLLQVDFQAAIRPKFTISLSQTSAWTLGNFNIVWDTITVQSWLSAPGSTVSDLRNIPALRDVGNSTSVDVGSSSDPSTWTDRLTTDWSDVPGARLRAGGLGVGRLVGFGHEVLFPRNQATVDPTQVSTSTVNFATSYSTQRKVFSYGGRYFVFYYSGSNILYKSSADLVTWSSSLVAGGGTAWGGPIGYNFDIYQSGSSIGLVWLYFNSSAGGDGTTALYFKHGLIVAGDIYFFTTVKVASWSQPYSWPPSVAIGSDGTFWVAGIWYDSNSNYNIWIYKSTNGSTFSLSTNYYTSYSGSRDDALQLIALPQGKLMSLTSHYYDQTIRWKIWNPLTPGGGSWTATQSFNVTLPANTPKWNLMSAVPTPDGFVYLSYEKYISTSQTDLATAHYNSTSNQWTVEQGDINGCGAAACIVYPSISTDSLGNLYTFWTNQIGSATYGPYFVSRSKGDFTWNFNTLQPFGSITNPTWLSASRVSSKEVLLSWTQGSASPYSIYLGSIPLPSGIASGPPNRPWSYQGLSPYEQYFTQNGEYISPGNGLLTVSQTDISDAGRNGLSLSISRVYSQPFTLDQGSPVNYETSPYASLGNGWQLNLPWVATQNVQGPKYLHFLNGEILPIVWNNITTVVSGDVFGTFTMTNHQTEDFVLNETIDLTTNVIQNYKLVTKDGTTYNFNYYGMLTTIIDRTGQNQLGFSYNPNNSYVSTITDTVGRTATFKYDSSNHLANVTYAGQIVKYSYSGSNLVTVTDAVSRKVTISYSTQSSWLISGIVNTAGGNSTYTYGSSAVGTDALNYYVTLQTVYNPGQVVKSSSFSYNITDGEITYTSVKQSDGQTVQGYTNYQFNSQSSSLTRTILNATLTQMLKDQFWFDPSTGRSVQDDTYSGTSLARSFYNSRFYDIWGNTIYTRDNTGHESYQSFANTNSQWMFQSPGSISTTTNGKVFYEDFNGPNLNSTAWAKGGSGTNLATTVAASLLKLQVASSVSGTTQSNWIRSIGTYNYPFYAEVNMQKWAGDGTGSVELILSPQQTGSTGDAFTNNDALRLVITDGPNYYVEKNVGGVTTTLWTGTAGGMHSLVWKFELTDRNTLRVYLQESSGANYQLVYSTTSLGLSSSFTPAYAYLSFENSKTTTYFATFDYMGLFGSNSITVNGLQSGQVVSLYDWNNVQQATGTVASGQTSLTLNATQMIFPYGYLQISELDARTVQFTSPTREFWGGSTYSYIAPFRSGGLTRTTTGFLQYQVNHFVDDSLPSGAVSYSDGGDAWVWTGNSIVPVIGDETPYSELVHASVVVSGTHEHYFNGSSTTLSATSGSFLNQYVYIPSTSPPSEIMLQFHTVGGTWEHRAYWGTNSITACGTTGASCGTNGTASRFYMGPIPSTLNAWIQLIVKTDDVGVNGLNINGWAYTLYNGAAFWDESELGTASGTITFNNLLAAQKVEIYNSQGSLKTSGTVATGQTSVSSNTYAAGMNAFPFRGTMKVYSTTGSLQYSSPLMIDVWGGDTYSYNQPIFSNSFNPGTTAATIHNVMIGTSQYQNATSIPEEGYSNFDNVGNMLQSLIMHNGSPITTTYTYDTYGNKLSMTSQPNGFTNPGFDTGTFAGWTTTGGPIIRGNAQHSGCCSAAPFYNTTTSVYQQFTLQQNFPVAFAGSLVTSIQFWYLYADPSVDAAQVLYTDGTYTQTTISIEQGSWTQVTLSFDANKQVSGVKFVRSSGSYTNIYLDDFSIVATQKTYYTYSPTYGSAYNTNVTRILTGNSNVTTSYFYNFTTGMNTAIIDPMGNRTDLQFDAINRVVVYKQQAINGTRTEVDTTYQDSQNNLYTKNQKGNYTSFNYDGQTRTTSIKIYNTTLSSPVIAGENATYNWQDSVKTVTVPSGNTTTYVYDYLKRLVKTTNPDGSYQLTSYNDASLTRSQYDENGHRTDYVYDGSNRLIAVRQYYSVTSYYLTSYYYNGVGSLAKVVDPNGATTTYNYDDLNRLVLTVFPDGFNETRTYDGIGNLLIKKDPNGKSIQYGYDTINRLLSATYPDASQAIYTYDKNGNRLSLSYAGNSATFNYDSRNRETSETWTISGTHYTLGYTYDSAGNLIGVTYPDATRISYTIDSLNRISSVKNGLTTLASFAYSKSASIGSITYGNGVSTSYTYDNRNRISRVKTSQGGTTLLNLNYTYDAASNVIGINTESYSYDFLSRLVSSTGAWGTVQYGYDGIGNRQWLYQSPTNTTYGYGNYYRLTSVGSTSYAYDNNGNRLTQVSGGTTTRYNYDFENRLTSVSQGSSTLGNYSYSPLGARIQKIESGTTTTYLNSGINVLYEKAGTAANDYIFTGNLLLAKLSGSNTYYFHEDALGSTRLVTTGSTTSFSTNYQPFGPQYGASGTDPVYKYSGKPQDSATGLYYYGARYYDTSVGRFISRDPAKSPLTDPQSQCSYAYARNNPESLKDSTGACLDGVGLAIGLVTLGLSLLGIWVPLGRVWDLVMNLYWNYLIPGRDYLRRGDWTGWAWNVALPGLLQAVLMNAIYRFLSWWVIGFFIARVLGGWFAVQVVLSVIGFIVGLAWSIFTPPFPPAICGVW